MFTLSYGVFTQLEITTKLSFSLAYKPCRTYNKSTLGTLFLDLGEALEPMKSVLFKPSRDDQPTQAKAVLSAIQV